MESIYNLEFNTIKDILTSWGEPEYRANQIWDGLYKQLWNSADQFTTLSIPLRKKLGNKYIFNSLTVDQVQESINGLTTKTLFRLENGGAIETVLMSSESNHPNRIRNTLCLSTQVGCGMGCVFCATGQMGLRRNLESFEIVEQFLHFARTLNAQEQKITNVVYMGMGEPFSNFKASNQSLEIITSPEGLNFGSRRITISTIGLVPGILQLAKEKPQINLAVSLHAANDELRSKLVPINKKYPLNLLLNACLKYVEITNRRITFEWALIQDINDSLAQAKTLVQRLRQFKRADGCLCHVNLIPLNPTPFFKYGPSSLHRANQFKGILIKNGFPCTIRKRRGIDIQAGCGMLSSSTI